MQRPVRSVLSLHWISLLVRSFNHEVPWQLEAEGIFMRHEESYLLVCLDKEPSTGSENLQCMILAGLVAQVLSFINTNRCVPATHEAKNRTLKLR